jgi:hypothetical protein
MVSRACLERVTSAERQERQRGLVGTAGFCLIDGQPQPVVAEVQDLPAVRQERDSSDRLVAAGHGRATGKYRATQAPPADSRAATSWLSALMSELVMNDQTLAAVDRLRPIAEQAGLSMVQLALAWVLRRRELASAIVGASRPEQIRANATASGIELTTDTLTAIDDALGDAPVREPRLASHARHGVTRRASATGEHAKASPVIGRRRG